MPVALRRFLLALFVVAMQAVAQAAEVRDVESPRASHEANGVRWTDWLRQVRSDNCEELFRARSLPEKCGNYSLEVQNDTGERLQCRMIMELSAPNEHGQVRIERDIVVEGGGRTALASRGPLKSVPVSFDSECWSLPAEVPPLATQAHCAVESLLDNPDDYYPPGSSRRQETGEAIIEFTVEAGSHRPKDVRLVRATGFLDLDNAALKLGHALEVNAQCATSRVRRSVVFDISKDPRDVPESLGCVIFGPPAMVLVTEPESK
jgi:TonB family protein